MRRSKSGELFWLQCKTKCNQERRKKKKIMDMEIAIKFEAVELG